MSTLRSLLLLLLCFPLYVSAQTTSADSIWYRTHYTKTEIMIPMRDGKKLFTAIYEPTDAGEKHPILLYRTPYSVAPYGADAFKSFYSNHWNAYIRENYIIVLQDVRGRYMSEGDFVDIRPYIENKVRKDKGTKDIDEASDSYDTIDWLVNNLKNNNGKVGVTGSSYPGFYATMAAASQHPALVAASPQAPVTEWFIGDDEHHNGAFCLMDNFAFCTIFGAPRPVPTTQSGIPFNYYTKDNYKFYLETGALKNFTRLIGDTFKHWNDTYQHPDYDSWWQARDARRCVQHIPNNTATLIVGGLFDAEDCFGAWNLQAAIVAKAHNSHRLVMGPWSHGGWYRSTGAYLGNVRFGANTAEWYQQHIEIPYFNYYLKGIGSVDKFKDYTIFFSGSNEWKLFDTWPPASTKEISLFLQPAGKLDWLPSESNKSFSEYTSDPAHPVPYTEDVHFQRTREYMTDDQRFASRRPDVLTFQTDTLQMDLTIAGPVIADLFTSISTTDADFVVKVIDVFPDNFQYNDSTDGKGNGKPYPMGGYQMLVRGEVMRGRYRNSFEKPQAFTPNDITEVKYTLPDIAHVFKKGHRIMVQIQSTWFPLIDRNPQQFINPYTCDDKDFIKSDIHIYHNSIQRSNLTMHVSTKI
ncbi:MAG: CocE/NonD family hydrolase [Bacteroidota bacterium]